MLNETEKIYFNLVLTETFNFLIIFSGLSTVISRFRDKSGVLEYSVGGLLTGALYKFSLGPKGMLAGGFFGGLIGTIGGLVLFISSKASGITMDDAYSLAKLYFETKDTQLHGAQRVCDFFCLESTIDSRLFIDFLS